MSEPALWAAAALLLCAGLFTAAFTLVKRLRVLRHRLHLEQVVLRATGALVSASDRGAVRDASMAAVIELLDEPASRSWRVDGDPGGSIASATDDGDWRTYLDGAELGLLPGGEGGIEVLAGPSLLHGTLGVPSRHHLVLVALPRRGMASEAGIVTTATPLSSAKARALRSVVAAQRSALDRLSVDDVLFERRSERRLRLMLRYASDVICILDHDLTIVYVTPGVEPIVGLPPPELLGMSWLELVVEDDAAAARDLVTMAQGGRPARGEIRLRTENGGTPYVDATVTEVIDEDLMGFVVTCHDISQRHELEQQLTHQAFHDALTGLANRALFRDRLDHAMSRARRSVDYAVLFIDLDDFKSVNDALGHAAGDALLREVTTRISGCLREGDTAARLGGDEFAVLLEDLDDDAQSESIASRMLAALNAAVEISGTAVTTGASIGIALGDASALTPEELMRNADLALYDAKNGGKGRLSLFAQDMHDAAVARLSLAADLRRAVENGELVVYYQPLVDLVSGAVTGLEALVRWNHPTRGMLQPREFIELAEESGIIVPLGRAVLLSALQAVVAWQNAHTSHRDLRIAVNLSGRQLQDPAIVDDVRSILESTGINPHTVVLEITESVLIPDDGEVLARLHALAALGVHLYIDDFGTGYSSLSYLQSLPVAGLKLAQEFVGSLPGNLSQSGIVGTIRGLAETMGLEAVVAEGIERPEQWESLLSLGYTSGQGYHLAVPMPGELVPNFLSGRSKPGEVPWSGEVNQLMPPPARGSCERRSSGILPRQATAGRAADGSEASLQALSEQ